MPEPMTRRIHSSKFFGLVWAMALATLASTKPVRHLICEAAVESRYIIKGGWSVFGQRREGQGTGLTHLVLLGQRTDVVLEGVGDPPLAHPHVGHTLQCVPGIGAVTQCSIQQLVEVVPVAEDDMATHVKQEALLSDVGARQATSLINLHSKQEATARSVGGARPACTCQ